MNPLIQSRVSVLLSSALLWSSFLSTTLGQTVAQDPKGTQEEVLRISTDLVQTDIIVLDNKGQNVKGLNRDQFELLVDGQPQPISFFESVETGSSQESSRLAAGRGQNETGAQRQLTLGAIPGRSFIFFVDDFHLSSEGIQRTSDLLNNFVADMGDDDQALVISPSGQIGFLQQFTDNKTALKLAASRLKYQAQAVPASSFRRPMTVGEALAIERNQRSVIEYKAREYIDDMGLERDPSSKPSTNIVGGVVVAPKTGDPGKTERQMTAETAVKAEARNIVFQANAVSEAVFSALEFVARGAGQVPGRKLFFFISDGFQFDIRSPQTTARLSRVIDSAARSGVAIYTVDSKGLTIGNVTAAQNTFSDIAIGGTGGKNHDPSTDATSVSLDSDSAVKEVLRTLAADTGGRAILNRNDLESGIKQILKETESYYVLAWKPLAVESGKPKFNMLKVSIKGQPGLRVLARKGFYSAGPPPLADNKPTPKESKAPALKPSETELRAAITSAFPRRQLGLASYTTYSNETADTYKIITFADLANYQLKPGAGSKAGEVDFYVVLLNDAGKSITSIGQKVNIAETSAQPFRVTATLPNMLPPGLYQVRVAARDALSGRIGSSFQWIEVPKFKQGELAVSSLILAEVTGRAGEALALDAERRFARSSSMLIQMFVYNALASNGVPDVAITLQVLQAGKQVIGSRPQSISAQGVTDLVRLPYGSEIPLSALAPGRYTLKVTANDRVAKTSASQYLNFTID